MAHWAVMHQFWNKAAGGNRIRNKPEPTKTMHTTHIQAVCLEFGEEPVLTHLPSSMWQQNAGKADVAPRPHYQHHDCVPNLLCQASPFWIV